MNGTAENWLKIGVAILTGIAAALGVQMSPAAKPEDVGAVVRAELAPLRVQVDHIERHQDEQDKRLTNVEAVVLAKDATP